MESIIGIDLSGASKNPTGIALLQGKMVQAKLSHFDGEILEDIEINNPVLVAIDAPLSFPQCGFTRKADRDMSRNGYRVLPPNFPHMRELTRRAVKLNKQIQERGYRTIEVHPTSSRKALQMPLKEWRAIQETLKALGLKGDIENRLLVTHEIDAVTAALTAKLHLKGQTQLVGDEQEGYIIVPKKKDWRILTI
ncbi:MAG: DUF429 domain-containing protein [Candidatus Bathyarchaeota archaeon]|nr:DUF429 domain-containing protein [Candidatus Bathyarchaeota archaeon]